MKWVIGYGNPLRQDDGIGWQIAAALAATPQDGISVRAAHQLMPEMAAELALADGVVFMDATIQGTPGTYTLAHLDMFPSAGLAASLTHHLTPAGLLALTQLLYGAAPAGWLITIAGRDFGIGETLSPPVEVAQQRIVRALRSWHPHTADALAGALAAAANG